ncbi:MAG: choice-of-anchor D domain-containing protein [Mycobacterium sp.]|nr:choice-of-anchor D domain-containing protein [Mycobacterium sp.]
MTAFAIFAAQARAAIYWTNWATGAIGRANLSGTDVSPRFIIGARNPTGVVLEGQHVYWTSSGGAAIGRANRDGRHVDQSFISGLAEGDLQGLAVDAHHIYWTDELNGSIGRANLDGTDVNQRLLAARSPLAVAVDRNHIYWTSASSIGRADLDGTHVQESFIANLPQPWGVAVDAQQIYWSDFSGDRIGRAKLDGTGVEDSFITGASHPTGLTTAAGHIYWTNSGTNTIGRANLDGTVVEQSFIQGNRIMAPIAIAVGVPIATARPLQLAFGRRPVGNYGPPKSVTISNTGTAPLRISPVNVSAGDVHDFLTFYDSCSRSTVPVGSHCEIHVRFGATAVGKRSAILTVTSNDPQSPLHIALSGTGKRGVALSHHVRRAPT